VDKKIKFRQRLKPRYAKGKHNDSFHFWGFVDYGFTSPVNTNHAESNAKSDQFTGLTDKNGAEWFESDIIAITDPEDQSIAVIVKGQFGWGKKYKDIEAIIPLTNFDLEWFVKVGNIYDDLTLLHPDEESLNSST